jgi:hypothetical protein
MKTYTLLRCCFLGVENVYVWWAEIRLELPRLLDTAS